jgi:hypothetical protein
MGNATQAACGPARSQRSSWARFRPPHGCFAFFKTLAGRSPLSAFGSQHFDGHPGRRGAGSQPSPVLKQRNSSEENEAVNAGKTPEE